MKPFSRYTLYLLISFAVALSSCEDKRFHTYTANVPIYLDYDNLRKSIEVTEPVSIELPGKIYFKDNYILLNEFMKGVHIIDISDPSSPSALAYIPVPGNIDMAIKDDILYLDSYTDLVMMDISDPENPVEFKRMEDILEYTLPPYDNEYPLAQIDEEEGVVIGWDVKLTTEEIQSNPYPWPIYSGYREGDILMSSSMSLPAGAAGSTYGVGGSMARFLTYDDYLLMLQKDNMLKVVDINDMDHPFVVYDKYIGWGLETMFIYEEYLYLGSTTGLYIVNIENPAQPYTTSVYSHVTSCDPVVVKDDLAYVTLRSGNMCGGTADLLEVIDIADKWKPERIASYPMDQPYGLGISDNTLFICQGENGLVVYDATDPLAISSNKIAEFTDIKATDVIPIDSLLYTIGEEGFYIYDHSDLNDIFQIGSILVPVQD